MCKDKGVRESESNTETNGWEKGCWLGTWPYAEALSIHVSPFEDLCTREMPTGWMLPSVLPSSEKTPSFWLPSGSFILLFASAKKGNFPHGSVIKNLPANTGDTGDVASVPVSGIPQRKKWQPTPVFLPGKFHGQRNLVGYSPRDHKESGDNLATEHTRKQIKYVLTFSKVIKISH